MPRQKVPNNFGQEFLEPVGGAACWVVEPRLIAAQRTKETQRKDHDMLSWAVIFFAVAIIAAIFGFGGIASASAGIAQILFLIFLALFAATMIARALRGLS